MEERKLEEKIKRDLHLKAIHNEELQGSFTGYASMDNPWENAYANVKYSEYNPDFCKKTAMEMIYPNVSAKPNMIAYDYYGKQIDNKTFLKNVELVTTAYRNFGIKRDDNVFILGINTPEIIYTMYALNNLGAISEWFNPLAISPELLRKYINEGNIKYIFAIDVMYDVLKEAIKGTNIECVIINSVKDSFPLNMNLLYNTQVFGLSHILNNESIKSTLEHIKENVENADKVETLNWYKKFLLRLDDYAKREKLSLKSSFYFDAAKDNRFLLWKDFLEKYCSKDIVKKRNYEEDMTTFIVHTGGTTGPVKRVAHTDYAINSAIYQASLVPVGLYEGMSSLHIIPPIVALGLENTHLERYYNMKTHLISTYDKNQFVPLIKKYKPNLLVCVPSFASQIHDSNSQLKPTDDLSFIKTILQGGEGFPEKIDREVDNTLKKHGSKTTSRLGFGQNEEFGGFTFNLHFDESDKRYGSCGVPLPGNKILIYDLEKEEELKYGRNSDGTYNIGELFVTGATLMQGYYGSDALDDENQFKIIHGEKYFDTGDQGYIDDDGILYWVTRNRRIIRTQDGKIFTNILENIINNFEEVLECCVVAAPDEKIVKVASCHIVLKPEYRNLSNEEYLEIISNIISRVEKATKEMYSYYIPGTYEFRSSALPRTSFGKVAFTELEEQNEKDYQENGKKNIKIRVR